MTHDPLCQWSGWCAWTPCAECEAIARAREDIAGAIMAQVPDSKRTTCRFVGSEACTCDEAGALAASIARGEAPK